MIKFTAAFYFKILKQVIALHFYLTARSLHDHLSPSVEEQGRTGKFYSLFFYKNHSVY